MAEVDIVLKRGSNTHGLYKERAALIPDNVYTFQASDGTYTELFDQKGQQVARFSKVLDNGSNMLSVLNTIFAKADVYEVIIDHKGSVTLNGTLECAGKKLTFKNNSRFIGTYTINNANIFADYRHFCFGGTPTITNSRTRCQMSSVMWYGAVGDGTGNQAPAIQLAMDTAIANNEFPRDLYFPKSSQYYRCTSGIVAYKWNGTDYQFFSLNLIGEKHNHFTSAAYSTRIYFTDDNSFGIGYQRARSSVIRGLSIEGGFNPSFGGLQNMFNHPYTTWATDFSPCRDTRNSPHCGIHIDPFFNFADPGGGSSGILESARYTSWNSWYRGTGTRGGSSAVNIEQCRIQGFVVGVGYSLNGWTLNCENGIIDKCAIEVCKAAIAYGQPQIKDNYIKHTIHWDRVHTIVDGVSYGILSGLRPCIAYVDGMNIAGGICRIFAVTSNFTGSARNIFAESLYKIGELLNLANFNLYDSEFDFIPPDSVNTFPDYHISATNLKFHNCTFKYYDDLFDKRIILKGQHISFDNCRFDLPPVMPYQNNNSQVVMDFNFDQCYSGNGKLIGSKLNRGIDSYYTGADIKIFSLGNPPTYTQDTFRVYSSNWYNDFVVNFYDYVTLTIDSNREASFTWNAVYVANIKVGDYVVESERANIPFIDWAGNDSYPVLGRVKTVNYTTGDITIHEVPRHINSGSGYFPGVLIQKQTGAWIVGDVTAGSPIATNVMVQDNIVPTALIGFRIGGNRVIAADNALRTITFAQNFGFSLPGYIISDLRQNHVIINPVYPPLNPDLDAYPLPFLAGTKWEMPQAYIFYPDSQRKVYTCTKSGYMNAATLGLGPTYQSEWILEGSVFSSLEGTL